MQSEELINNVARRIYEDRHAGMNNIWNWDDNGLDDEHPGVRAQYEGYAKSAIAALSAAEPQPAPSVAVKAFETNKEMLTAFGAEDIREGSRKWLGDGTEEDPWEDYYEVPFHALDRIRSALSAQVQDVAGPAFVPWGQVERTNDGDLAIYGATYHVRLANFTTGAASGLNVGDMFYRAAPAKQEG